MKRLISTTAFCVLCVLFAATPFNPTAYSTSRIGLTWWVNVYEKNNQYLEVTVKTDEDGRRYQNVWFDATYFNQQGERIGTLTGKFTDEKGELSVLQAGKVYRRYYKLDSPSASVKGGTMHFTVIQSPVPLYRVPEEK